MAKFTYRMQNILDVKYKLETQAKSAFSAANAKLMQEEEVLSALQKRKKLYELAAKSLMKGNINIKEIKENKRAQQAMDYAISEQEKTVKKAEEMVYQAREKLNQVMMERKTHEKLKEKQFEEFKQELNMAENKSIDELVSYSYSNNQD